MTGRQINFYILEEDVKEFLSRVKSNRLVNTCQEFGETKDEIVNYKMDLNNNPQRTIYLVKNENISKLIFEYSDKIKKYYLVNNILPVIEFSTGFYYEKDKVLIRGRLYYQEYYLDDDMEIKYFDNEFYEWADEVFKIMRKMTVGNKKLQEVAGEEYTFRASERVIEYVKNGGKLAINP